MLGRRMFVYGTLAHNGRANHTMFWTRIPGSPWDFGDVKGDFAALGVPQWGCPGSSPQKMDTRSIIEVVDSRI